MQNSSGGGYIDAQVWPRIAEIPDSFKVRWRARAVEAEFAAACAKAGLRFDGENPDLVVLEEALFARIADAGWLGLAESFMAGEWESENLVTVLSRLLEVGYQPKASITNIRAAYNGLEISPALVRLTAMDSMSSHGTLFSSGVPTTERIAIKSFVPGAGRGNEPAHHFVDDTTFSDPTITERADLADAQMRSVLMLLDAAKVTRGTHVLDFPASTPALALAATERGATVDNLTADAELATDMREILAAAGLSGEVHVELLDSPMPTPRSWPTHYDAVISIEKLEHMGAKARRAYAKTLDRMLVTGGRAAIQSMVAVTGFEELTRQTLSVAQAYLWPDFQLSTVTEIHRLFDVYTGLRVVSQTHIGSHHMRGVSLQREIFEGRLREAAAEGFDAVYRRLWLFYLSMLEALYHVGALDTVQCTVTVRNRRGRR
ncbi:class I SAM-dependent methyltransferase [Corynebacterium kutscheri]|uniref:Cyclopropane fatty acid synthase n=1 Tax=Corynebacterium kutscheri TaxID=35755 RepID=A0A0F6QZI6_9CORY|nr:class I SAM-dependent methyltransferase [Corynebacterium kutscheri]AKE41187.1 methyltransferase, cyclopropane fatty acid synthase [Corynebacterium kutscheri]VEH08463.1 Cyclopropane fatty acid synthase [Corynebacterium kutscheri]VEH09509.1 Cyclopropane fatty acid synthase [Corynebacterium kutscheri]